MNAVSGDGDKVEFDETGDVATSDDSAVPLSFSKTPIPESLERSLPLDLPDRSYNTTPFSDTSMSAESVPDAVSRPTTPHVIVTETLQHNRYRGKESMTVEDIIAPFRFMELIASDLQLPRSYQQCFTQGFKAFAKVHAANSQVQAVLKTRNILNPSRQHLGELAFTFLQCLRAHARNRDYLASMMLNEMVRALQVNGDMNSNFDETELILLSRQVARMQSEFLPLLWEFTRLDRLEYDLWRDYVLQLWV